jgi:hypothetical protein
VISGIAQLLKDGLGVGPAQQDRAKLIDYCIKDLKANHPGAIWSLQVVQHIFGNVIDTNPVLCNLDYFSMWMRPCASHLPESCALIESTAMNNENGSQNQKFYTQTCSSLPELYISNLKAYTSATKAIPPTPSPTVSCK